MHTTEFLENSNLSVKPKPDSKIICFPFFFFSLFGPRSSVADLECFEADPDPSFHADADADPAPDPDPKNF